MSKKEKETDIVYEEEETSSFNPASTDKLKKKLKKCEEERKEYLEGWQKARADLINLRKKDEEEKQQIRRYASEGIVTELVSVLDSYDMAFSNKELWEKVPEEWRVGVEYIHSQLLEVVKNHGLKEIDPLGKKFDSKMHEAIETVDGNEDEVVEVVRKGYELNGKIIRAAKVKVGNGEK